MNNDGNSHNYRVAAMSAALLLVGCFGPPNLPTEIEVVLPNDVRETVQAGADGATNIGDATWSAFRKPDTGAEDPVNEANPPPGPYGGLLNGGFLARLEPDTLLYRVEVAANGRATEVFDNAFYAPEIFGDEFYIDEGFYPGRTFGLSYAATTFGATREDQFGIAIPVDVRFLGIPLGNAVFYAWGTRGSDRLDGIFGYTIDLTPLPDLLIGSGGDQYPFYATLDP